MVSEHRNLLSSQKYTEIRCSAPLQISRKQRDSTSEKKITIKPAAGQERAEF